MDDPKLMMIRHGHFPTPGSDEVVTESQIVHPLHNHLVADKDKELAELRLALTILVERLGGEATIGEHELAESNGILTMFREEYLGHMHLKVTDPKDVDDG